MKHIIAFCSTVLITVLLFSCNNNSTEQIPGALMNELVSFECRAFKLRNQRFQLADRMKFIQDSISSTTSHQDSVTFRTKLEALGKQKDSLLTASLQLADSIKNKMDFVMSKYFTDKAKEQEFNRVFNALLTKNGCK